MPQIPIENNDRMSLRTAVSAAQEAIDKNERVGLTQRNNLHVLDLLENHRRPMKNSWRLLSLYRSSHGPSRLA